MIEVKITPRGIQMQGHAGQHVDGKDLACAAVSALTCNLINALQDLTDNRIRADTDSGWTRIEWQQLSAPGRLLVDSWFLGLAAVNQEYNCITYL